MSIRKLLRRSYNIRTLFDLGDTKLFSAAVLPAIVIAERTTGETDGLQCSYTRVYETKVHDKKDSAIEIGVLESIRRNHRGTVRTMEGDFIIERGTLEEGEDTGGVWRLSSISSRSWLATINSHRHCSFADVGTVRVGIKTTADSVFIRDDWDSLPSIIRPEKTLLRPLITHHSASRWNFGDVNSLPKKVLFTHTVNGSHGRKPIDLESFPGAKAYLEIHRSRLESREYVLNSGRRWYEIWVPQNPSDWLLPKIVFPDITEVPRFALDNSRTCIVNGDCYWITLKPGVPMEWLMMMLAVANSSFISKYYDLVFHNKLYSGRRRFMSQYVKAFPLPNVQTKDAQVVLDMVSRLIAGEYDPDIEGKLDHLVWSLFGVEKEREW